MIKRLFTLTVLLASVLAASAAVRGDVNGDGVVDIDDLNAVINVMVHKNADTGIGARADIDGNGMVDIDDLNVVINVMVGKDSGDTDENTFTVNGVKFRMRPVEGGTFTMGATAEQGSDAYDWEKPAHKVTLSSFSIGQTEVTQALWQAVMGSNPSDFLGNLQRPVEQVSWNDCQAFITKLNQLTGRNFRLPTEAEWEYAARGGNKSKGYKYAGSNTIGDVAWYDDNSDTQSHPVASKAPNELMLYDMSGNIREWCQDWYDWYDSAAQTNPTGPSWGMYRVIRGGCWGLYAEECRVAYRTSVWPEYNDWTIGFRLAL